jgi:hypothetical protein
MNFQKLFGPLTKPREGKFFNEIIGHDHFKRLFSMALRSHEPTRILLSGPPALSKTIGIVFYRWRKHYKSRDY